MPDKEAVFCSTAESGEQFITKVNSAVNPHRARRIAGCAIAFMVVNGFGVGAFSNEVSASELPECTLSNDSNGDGISYLETEVSDGRWKLEDYTNSGDWAWQPISMEEFKANQPGGVMNLAGKDLVPSGQEIWRLGKCSKTVIVSNPVIKDTKVTQESRAKTDSSVEKVKKEERKYGIELLDAGIKDIKLAEMSGMGNAVYREPAKKEPEPEFLVKEEEAEEVKVDIENIIKIKNASTLSNIFS